MIEALKQITTPETALMHTALEKARCPEEPPATTLQTSLCHRPKATKSAKQARQDGEPSEPAVYESRAGLHLQQSTKRAAEDLHALRAKSPADCRIPDRRPGLHTSPNTGPYSHTTLATPAECTRNSWPPIRSKAWCSTSSFLHSQLPPGTAAHH